MPTNIEISPSGDLLVFKEGYTKEFVFETIKKKKLRGLRIFSQFDEKYLLDISFLYEYTFLEALSITSEHDYDFSFLAALPLLKRLSFNVPGKNAIDLSNQIDLESLSLNWRKSLRGIDKCQRMKVLTLVEYKEPDLSPIKTLKHLERLSIKTGSVKSLTGLEDLKSLNSVLLGYCRVLQSVKALNGLKDLRSIEIEFCSKITDYENLTNLPSLEELTITDCKGIRSINFIQNFPALMRLKLLGSTDVLDGDMVPARRIKDVIYRHRKHYNIKIENPENDALIKENIAKIKRYFK